MKVKTTLELEKPLYDKLKSLCLEERTTLKALVDELIVIGLSNRAKKTGKSKPGDFLLRPRDMRPLIDFEDKEAVAVLIDREDAAGL